MERIIQELQRPFDDGAHILYVNGAKRDDTPLGRLMQDFFCENPRKMNYKELAQRADYFKAEAEGGRYHVRTDGKIRREEIGRGTCRGTR